MPNHIPGFLLVVAISCQGAFSARLANVATGQEPKEYARSFVQSFKGVQPNPKELTLSGLDAEKCVKHEAEGLRITLPAGNPGERPDVGMFTRFAVRGDFEITLDYEILQESASAEPDSSGARFGLTINLATPTTNMATFTRRTAATGNDYVAWRSVSLEPDGPTDAAAKTFKTTAKRGRLRLVRSESTLSFYVAEGAEKEFKLLDKTTIRRDDLKTVRFFGVTGDKNASLDVRITSLCIRAEAFPMPALPPAPLPSPKLAERVEYLLHEGVAKQPMLRFLGGESEAAASTQPEGLRFNLPAGRRNAGDVGVESRLRLHGDFEVTLEYDLLALPNPGPEYGAGASLQILFDTPDALKARIGRTRKAVGARFGGNIITLGPDGKNIYKGLPAPTANDKESKGRLRMVRVGKMLTCQVAEGAGVFRLMATKEIGLADVMAAQALCTTGGQPLALEVRFPRFEVRASEIVKKTDQFPDKAVTAKVPGNIASPQPERVAYQFRDGYAKHPNLRLVGPETASMAVVQPQGLSFNVPAGREYNGDVGIESLTRLRGDFELTLAYELVALPNPPPPLGAGAVLQIVLDTPDGRKARLDRLHRIADDVFGANAIVNEDFRGLAVDPADAKLTTGQLRMIRIGKVLTYHVQEADLPFREIASFEIGDGDVVSVQALCATSWQPVAATIRFPRLELRSGGAIPIGTPEAETPIMQRSSGGRTSLLIVIGLGIVLMLVVIGFVIYLWRRRAAALITKSKPAVPTTRAAVVFACADCGKKLRGKPELAGKKIKCPQCGKMVLVKAG